MGSVPERWKGSTFLMAVSADGRGDLKELPENSSLITYLCPKNGNITELSQAGDKELLLPDCERSRV